MSAPFNHAPLYDQLREDEALTEAVALAEYDRWLRGITASFERIATPLLLGTAGIAGILCLLGQIAVVLQRAG